MDTIQLKPPDLALVGDPVKQLEQAERAASALMELVQKRQLFTNMGTEKKPRNHLHVEAWQTVAHFYGVSARITTVDDWTDEATGEQGFSAWAEAIHIQSGRIIGSANAICTSFEENWGTRPKYRWENGRKTEEIISNPVVPRFQVASMAQTRAIGKVLRGLFAFVVVLAGFEPTPAEEMTGNERSTAQPRQEKKADTPQVISEGQRKKLFATRKDGSRIPIPDLVAIWKKHGFTMAAAITVDKYDQILRDIEAYHA